VGDLGGILDSFEGLPELRSAVLMEDLGERGLFRAEWEPRYLGIMRAIEATGATVVSATGSEVGWTFELRAGDGEQFSQFQRYCDEHDVAVSLARLSRLSETGAPAEDYVTVEQREALLLAYREDVVYGGGGGRGSSGRPCCLPTARATSRNPWRRASRPSRRAWRSPGRHSRSVSSAATGTSSRGHSCPTGTNLPDHR
jgi:hypothetical protein